MMPTRLHSTSTSSMLCVVSTTAQPSSLLSVVCSAGAALSRPASGSEAACGRSALAPSVSVSSIADAAGETSLLLPAADPVLVATASAWAAS